MGLKNKDSISINEIFDADKLKFSISSLSNDEKDEIIKAANKICGHKFDLLGSGEVKISHELKPKGLEGYSYDMNISNSKLDKIRANFYHKINDLEIENKHYSLIDWHVDFKTGYRWDENIWYKKIKYGGSPGVDIKVPWELSRMQHLVTLGQAYLITGDKNYASEYVYQVVDWIENNRPQFGVNWKCTMDVAIRAANIALGYCFFKDSKAITEKFKLYLLKNIYIHGNFIVNNLEYSFITSNHYLSDISGLFFIAHFLSKYSIGKKWKNFAIKELVKEMEKQVYGDGGDFESSTCYHRLVLELFFFPAVYSIRNENNLKNIDYVNQGKEIFGEKFINKLYKMFDFVLHTLKPDGKIPQIGDNDNGRLFIFGNREVLDMRYLLTFAAIFFKEPKFKIREFGFCTEALWLFGKAGFKVWNELEGASYRNIDSKGFPDSRIYVMRKNNNYLLVSACPNGQSGNGGHAHNDKLSFALFSGGKDIIVDPGTYLYTPLPKRRNQFRSTSYHNTIVVDGKEQNRFAEDSLFTLENDSKTKVIKWETNGEYDYIEAEHFGYKRLEKPITHRRQIIFNKQDNFWVIKDVLEGEGKHNFDLYFHLDGKIDIKTNEDSLETVISIGSQELIVEPLNKERMNFSFEKSWISKKYGQKEETILLKYSQEGDAPLEFLFLLSFGNAGKDIPNYINKISEKKK